MKTCLPNRQAADHSLPSAQAQAIVSRLLAVISRREPLAAARELLHPQVALYMDGRLLARGPAAWLRWVYFLQQQADKRGLRDLIIAEPQLSENAGEVQVTAHWQATADGQRRESAAGRVCYQIRDGRIIRIATHRSNYVFIYGSAIARSRLAFYFLLLRLILSPRPPV